MKAIKKLVCLLLTTAATVAVQAQQVTPQSQMERLDRGVVAVRSGTNFISWRFLGSDDPTTTFDVVCDGTVVKEGLTVTNFKHYSGKLTSKYQVVAKVGGQVVDTSSEVGVWDKYLSLQLSQPAAGSGYSYTPNDMSVGDIDADGQYELFVKWDPTNSKDNSEDGVTGNVFIDCYRLDGTFLWRIDLGRNIRAGAHYTQYMVYDFDGDGRAEMMCKTAPGSKDGEGVYVNQATDDAKIKAADNTKSWLTSSGRMDGGHEYLTVFDGMTGKAINTIAYNPNRNTKSELSEAAGTFNWAEGKTDTHGYNRGDRYLAAVAYLDGADKPASAVFCRGYYTYAYLWAVSFDGERIIPRWLHRSDNRTQYSVTTYSATGEESKQTFTAPKATSGSGSNTMFGNGNHNISVADVDGDGCDEIIWGSAACDHDGRLLYATGFGHGDAIHMGDLNPDRPGLEVFQVHEEKGTYAWDIHDAATGEILWKGGQSGQDNGRGCAADIIKAHRGYEFWSSYGGFDSSTRIQNPFNAITGKEVGSKKPAMNFRIYWDGDDLDELFDGKYDSKTNFYASPAITKAGSSSISDLVANFNDADHGFGQSCNYTKSTPCLQADILGDWREELILWNHNDPSRINIYTTIEKTDLRVPTLMHDHTYRMGICWQNVAYNQPPHLGYYLPDYVAGTIEILEPTAISTTHTENKPGGTEIYDLQGRRLTTMKRGVNIVREGNQSRKVIVR